MYEHVETCLNLFRFNMLWIDAILKHVWTCWNMSKLVQILYELVWFISFSKISEHVQTNMSKLVQIQYETKCYDSYDSQTCLNLFRINMTWIVKILKHVYTCSKSIWYELIWFSNMSEHVETCLNLFRINMKWIVTILKHVLTCSWSIWCELMQFSNMSRLEMKTWWNTLKLSKCTLHPFETLLFSGLPMMIWQKNIFLISQ